jgi:flagellar basal body-associated protein FliL
MKSTANEDRTSSTMSARMGVGSWIILIVLLSLLVATGVVIYIGWTLGNGTDMPTSGYAAMALGVIISLAVGFGLMALIFYSSRKGYDEPPVMIVPENDPTESKDAGTVVSKEPTKQPSIVDSIASLKSEHAARLSPSSC